MGVAIMAAGTDASPYANNYIPPVSGPKIWGNLESSRLASARRLRNWGDLAGSLSMTGNTILANIGVSAVAGVDSRLIFGTLTADAYTVIALMNVDANGPLIRHRNIRLSANSSKHLTRVMDAGTTESTIQLPASGAFMVYLSGDTAGHEFGLVASTGVQKVTSSALNTGTTSTFLGGSNMVGTFNPWAAYSCAFYDRKLTDAELLLIHERMVKRAVALGVTVNV